MVFGLVMYKQLKGCSVHKSMREISELIYETCKTYLITQGKFILVLWAFIAIIIGAYFGWLSPVEGKPVALTFPSSCSSAWWESRAATAWPGLASG